MPDGNDRSCVSVISPVQGHVWLVSKCDMPTVSSHVSLVTKSEIIARREPWTCPRTAPCSSVDSFLPAYSPTVAPDSGHARDRACFSWPQAPHRNTQCVGSGLLPLILLVMPRQPASTCFRLTSSPFTKTMPSMR